VKSTFAKKTAMEFQKQEIEELLNGMLATFNESPENILSFFAEDAYIQYPYSERNSAVMNRQQYFDHLSMILPMMHSFHLHEHRLYATDEPGTYWATLDLEYTIQTTGKIYRQNYILQFRLNEDKKITQYYEYGNPLKIAAAMRP
jgi:ketosteroid isomerase-like protein